ncbi:hypothetical protein K504DRAFT_481632 [Pleomassaria siparia CBS 279.74]|uniref:Dockerin type 1 n=1 Tax=Pleomassaria siparia CBS 279.74 TaxID=1314801 RepID=A0A6G1KCQ5_9PLEO|nr:hypothetical protein K504DRAFT_481632 [Pleomassaria siparia CBS 279.74]
MFTFPTVVTLTLAYYANHASARPAGVATAVAPAEYTANPSVGGGSGSYKDSAHFRLYNVADASAAAQSIKVLEAAHQCFVEEQGWRTPGLAQETTGNNGPWYKTNIYKVAESDIPGAAGVQTADPDAGLAYLKVLEEYIAMPDVVVHEYGHAMHYSEKNWIDQTRTGAWWETIANFIADSYIATPLCEKAKTAAGLAGGDSLIELDKVIGDSHQVIVDATADTGNNYQAWPFLSYITNNPDSYTGLGKSALLDMIRKYDLNSNETPLHSLERLLSGVTIQKVIGRYWARMAYVDIGHEKAQALFNTQRETLTYANLDSNGNGKYTAKTARQPRYMGANIIPLTTTASTVSVTVTATGNYTATLAVKAASGAIRYVDVDGSASATLATGEEASLVVVNTPALVQYDAFSLSAEVSKGLDYSIQLTGATA